MKSNLLFFRLFLLLLFLFQLKVQAQDPNLVWAKSLGGTNSDLGQAIATDAAGNVYTTGYFAGTADFDPNAGVFNLSSAGSYDVFVSKLDAAGNLVWAKNFSGTNDDRGQGITTDAAGNVYITGYFAATVDFDPNAGVTNLTSAGIADIFVCKLDASGNLVWAKNFGGTSNDFGNGISVDAAGNVYTTGQFIGTADFDPNAGEFNLTSAGSNDIFISKLDAAGNLVWAKALGGTNMDIGQGIATDATGNVYTTGYFLGIVDFDPNAGVFNLTSVGGLDIFVCKLDADGNLVWAKNFGGTSDDTGQGIATDAAGNVYTTGFFQGTVDFDPNAGVSNLTSAGSYDIFVSKLDAAGNLVWAKNFGGTSADVGGGISVDATGNVYTAGYFAGYADFDPNAGVSNLTSADGSYDVFISKLDAAGNLVWAKAFGGTANDFCNDISVDAMGNVYTTGQFIGTADFDPNAGVFDLTSVGDYDVFIHKMSTPAASLNFDGIDDKVVIGNTMNTILDPLNTITVEAWVNPTNTTFNGVIIGNYHNSTNTEMQFLLRRDFDTFTFWVNDGTGFKTVDSGLASVVVNTWQHVAGVWDGSSLHIYVDGILKGTTTGVTGSSFATTNNSIVIGSNSYPEHFAGSIDEVRIWNRSLNQCEIQNNQNAELASGQTGLLAYYQFNQGIAEGNNTSVTTLVDATGNYNGTLTNFTLTSTTSNWVTDGAVVTGTTNPLYVLPDTTITNNNDELTVAESGATYQWATCDGNDVYSSIAGATSQSYTATNVGDYAVFVTKNGCSLRSSCINIATLGTTSFNSADFSYYPNPTNGTLNLSYTKEITDVEVLNLLGQTLLSQKGNNLEMHLDLSKLAPSTYLVKVISEGQSKTIKVVKQ